MRPVPVIGCGGGGCRVVSGLVSDALVEPVTVNLSACGGNPTVPLDSGGRPDCRGDPHLGWALAASGVDDILMRVGGRPAAMVVATLGGGTGSGVLEAVLDRSGDTMMLAVIGIPFSFETSRRGRARRQLRRIAATADRTVVFDMDRLTGVIGGSVGVSEALDRTAELMRDAVRRLAELMEGPFSSLFTEKVYTVAYAGSPDPDAVAAALEKGYSSGDPAHGRIVIHAGSGDHGRIAREVCDRTGIYPEVVRSRGSSGPGMMMFIPIACRS